MSDRRLIFALLASCFCAVWLYAQAEHANVSPRRDLYNYASPQQPLDLPKLVEHSSVIVVAEVTRLLDSPGEFIRDEEVNQAKLYAAEVTVREVLKGNIQPGKMVIGGMMPITATTRPRGGPLKANTVRIFFLVREHNSWRFADPFYGALIAAPVTPRPTANSATERVMEQLLAALKSEPLSSDEKRDLISELRGSQDERIVPALRAELETSRDDAVTTAILASLIERNDASALTKARQYIKSDNSKYAALLILSMARLNRADLLPEICNGLESPIPGVRVVTANALAQSQLPEAERLVRPLLDDPNRQLVTQVMVTLAGKYKQPDWAPEWYDDKKWDEMRQHWRQFLETQHSTGQ